MAAAKSKMNQSRYQRAAALYRAGDFKAAESAARDILSKQPKEAMTWNLLGVVLKRQRRFDEAIHALQQCAKHDAKLHDPWVNLGNIYLDRNQGKEAVEMYSKALKIRQRDPEIIRLLGRSYKIAKDYPNALSMLENALLLQPKSVPIRIDLAAVYTDQQDYARALEELAKAETIEPDNVEIMTCKARNMNRQGKVQEAIAMHEAILAKHPDDIKARLSLGNLYLNTLFDREKANACYSKVLELRPDHAAAAERLCNSLINSRYGKESDHIQHAHDVAVKLLDSGAALLPAVSTLQNVFLRTADYDNIARVCKDPDAMMQYWVDRLDAGALHNQLARVETPQDRDRLVHYHRLWGQKLEAQAKKHTIHRSGRKTLGPKIKVGFMSSDLRRHPVAYFALPLFEADRSKFELYVYSFNPSEPDRVQRHITSKVAAYRQYVNMPDAEVAQSIADDDLDILFELGGTTMMNRVEVMAYKAAPVQASWLGYPHSAGPSTIDYIVVDRYIKPPRPELLIEKPFEMPHSWVTLNPMSFRDVEINPVIPELRKGYITFGTANNPYKYTPKLLETWAKTLMRVPNSHFVFVRPEGGTQIFRDNITREFAKQGVSADRVEFVAVRGAHLPHYNDMDIALECFPQSGGTTTCETLWMGVPPVCLTGEALFERLSTSLASNAGLGDLCSNTVEEYIDVAVKLAADQPRRIQLRQGLRDQIRRSPLGDARKFVDDFYRLTDEKVREYYAGLA